MVAKGRVGPGEVLAIDTETGELLQAHDIDNKLKDRQPYKQWLKQNSYRIRSHFNEDDYKVDHFFTGAFKRLSKDVYGHL